MTMFSTNDNSSKNTKLLILQRDIYFMQTSFKLRLLHVLFFHNYSLHPYKKLLTASILSTGRSKLKEKFMIIFVTIIK